jgi:hypothetical protein
LSLHSIPTRIPESLHSPHYPLAPPVAAFFVLAGINVGTAGCADEMPVDRGIGTTIQDCSLNNTEGKPFRLYSFAGKKAVVTVFLGIGCPVSDLYLPRLAELAMAYEKKGVIRRHRLEPGLRLRQGG